MKAGPLAVVAGITVLFVLTIGFIVWLWTIKGHSALTASTGAVTVDPDPAFAPPAAKELLKPGAKELPARIPLERRLSMLIRGAAAIPDVENRFAANDRVGRWEIRFPSGDTAETYARQLDGLGIELGVIGGGDRIAYGSHFSQEHPEQRRSRGRRTPVLYDLASGAMRDLDNALLSRAKISTTDRIVAQFYPPQWETTLAALEKQFAGDHPLAEVRHTVFALVPRDKGYEFRVVEQEYVSGEVKYADAAPAKPNPAAPAARPKP